MRRAALVLLHILPGASRAETLEAALHVVRNVVDYQVNKRNRGPDLRIDTMRTEFIGDAETFVTRHRVRPICGQQPPTAWTREAGNVRLLGAHPYLQNDEARKVLARLIHGAETDAGKAERGEG